MFVSIRLWGWCGVPGSSYFDSRDRYWWLHGNGDHYSTHSGLANPVSAEVASVLKMDCLTEAGQEPLPLSFLTMLVGEDLGQGQTGAIPIALWLNGPDLLVPLALLTRTLEVGHLKSLRVTSELPRAASGRRLGRY